MVTQQVIVTARDFSADAFRLLELNADVEQALQTGDKCVRVLLLVSLCLLSYVCALCHALHHAWTARLTNGHTHTYARIDRVFIVGGPTDRAVLCTSSKSFFLTKEDTSNLRLLTEHTTWEAPATTTTATSDAMARDEIVVRGSAAFHYLVHRHLLGCAYARACACMCCSHAPACLVSGHCALQLQPKAQDTMRLKALLMESPFEQTRASAAAPLKRAKHHRLYTTDDLVTALQTSEREVLDMLAQLHAFQDGGVFALACTCLHLHVCRCLLHDIDNLLLAACGGT